MVLRQHPRVLDLPFRDKIGRPERDNAIDQYLLDSLSSAEEAIWQQSFTTTPKRLTGSGKSDWLAQQHGVVRF